MRAAIDKYTEDLVVNSHRIERELGFRPQVAFAVGWLEVVKALREADQL